MLVMSAGGTTGFGRVNRGGLHRRRGGVPGRVKGSRPDREVYGRLWPNGEFTVGYVATSKETPDPVENLAGFGTSGSVAKAVVNLVERGEAPGLDSGSKSSQPTKLPPKTYGAKGITTNGKRMVRNMAWWLEENSPRGCLSFLTLTVPPMREAESRLVAEKWGDITRRFMQWVKRQLIRVSLPGDIVWIVEVQPKRGKKGDLGAYHIHSVFQGRSPGKTWAIRPDEFGKQWNKELARAAGRTVDSSNSWNVQRVKKSAQGYLGKYMSKGSQSLEEIKSLHGDKYLPRQWWGGTSELKRGIRRATKSGNVVGMVLDQIVYRHCTLGPVEGMHFCRKIEIKEGEVTVAVAWVGRMSSTLTAKCQNLDVSELL